MQRMVMFVSGASAVVGVESPAAANFLLSSSSATGESGRLSAIFVEEL